MKEIATFDQVLIEFLYNKIKTLNNDKTNFKIVNDTSLFQQSDIIKDYTIILVKTYGGERSSLPDIDASPLNIQIQVNTDNPNKWKRIINNLINEINGVWNTLTVEESDDFEQVSYYFIPTINNPTVLSATNQIGESSRHTIVCYGSFFYTTNQALVLLPIYEIEVDGISQKLKGVLSSSLVFTNITEAYETISKPSFLNKSRGANRSLTLTLLMDLTDETHNFLMARYFSNDISNPITIKIELTEHLLELDMNIESFASNFTYGSSSTVQIQLSEAS